MALYLDVFVGVIQSFMKIPAVHALAPTQTEPPFLVAQAVVLALFVVLGFCGAQVSPGLGAKRLKIRR